MALMLVAHLLFAGLMVAAVVFFAWLYQKHLRAEITWLRGQVDYYAQRGDRALDKVASLSGGVPIATALPAQPYHAITAETLEQEVRRLVMGDHEVSHAGAVTE